MGFLDAGVPLDWELSSEAQALVRRDGVQQLINLWRANVHRSDTQLKWGEEIELILCAFPREDGIARVALCADEALRRLETMEEMFATSVSTLPTPDKSIARSAWRPEYANYMVEAIPGCPYESTLDSSLHVLPSMAMRRWKLSQVLPPHISAVSLSAWPTQGLPDWVASDEPVTPSRDGPSQSRFLADEIISPHPRFATLTANIRKRRGSKVSILVPLLKSENSESDPQFEQSRRLSTFSDRHAITAFALDHPNPVKDHIYMDAMGFGMGACCLQATFLAPDCSTARYLHDQLVVLAPLWLALTASTPFLRGFVAETDTRWDTISQCVDCRTDEELSQLTKSRYSGISLYIADRGPLTDHEALLNDVAVPLHQSTYEALREAGLDSAISRHFAYLYMRDPMVIFSDKIDLDLHTSTAHFESIQSTNWNSVRFKPPPPSPAEGAASEIGWRVELRTPEIQMTDFENAAVAMLSSALVQAILEENWDVYIPMSCNDSNLATAQRREAILKDVFYFRNDTSHNASDRTFSQRSLHSILFHEGVDEATSGIFVRLRCYIQRQVVAQRCSMKAAAALQEAMALFEARASGRLPTTASYLRSLLAKHPEYKHDSVVPPAFATELANIAATANGPHSQLHDFLQDFFPSVLSADMTYRRPPIIPHDSALLTPESAALRVRKSSSITNLQGDGGDDMSGARASTTDDSATPTKTRQPTCTNVSMDDFTRCWLTRLPGSESFPKKSMDLCSTCCATSTVGCDDAAVLDELPDAARLGFESNTEREFYHEIWMMSA